MDDASDAHGQQHGGRDWTPHNVPRRGLLDQKYRYRLSTFKDLHRGTVGNRWQY